MKAYQFGAVKNCSRIGLGNVEEQIRTCVDGQVRGEGECVHYGTRKYDPGRQLILLKLVGLSQGVIQQNPERPKRNDITNCGANRSSVKRINKDNNTFSLRKGALRTEPTCSADVC